MKTNAVMSANICSLASLTYLSLDAVGTSAIQLPGTFDVVDWDYVGLLRGTVAESSGRCVHS